MRGVPLTLVREDKNGSIGVTLAMFTVMVCAELDAPGVVTVTVPLEPAVAVI